MPERKSNLALLQEMHDDIKEVKKMQTTQGQDIESLKRWKIAEDAYRAALKQVRKEEQEDQYGKLKTKEAKAWLDILKQLGPIITIVGALLYAYAATKGIH